MRINLTSVLVDDREKALHFYSDVPGFVKKHDIPIGQFKVAVVSPEGHDDVELVLKLNQKPAEQVFQKATFEDTCGNFTQMVSR